MKNNVFPLIFYKGLTPLRVVKSTIKIYGDIGLISFKDWDTVIIEECKLKIFRKNGIKDIYFKFFGVYGRKTNACYNCVYYESNESYCERFNDKTIPVYSCVQHKMK